jgi:hypothetical protein
MLFKLKLMKNLLFLLLLLSVFSCTPPVQDSLSSGTLSGSYATMLPIDGFLYVVDDMNITTYDIADNLNPVLIDKQNVGFEIESLFHYDGVLFIGSTTAMHIFTIEENGVPLRQSQTEYNFNNNELWTSCDPIVANDKYAFVTLSTSQFIEDGCFSWNREANDLRIYNIENFQEPELISLTEMDFPKGLALTGDYLFVCEGNLGIKLFDVSDKEQPIEIWSDLTFESFDVILKEGLMMVVGPDALRQYDYTDINNITFIEAITF